MSAFMVNKAHIDALVAGALAASAPEYPGGPGAIYWTTPDGERKTFRPGGDVHALGQLLVDANLASIHARYPDTVGSPKNMPGPRAHYWDVPYRFAPPLKARGPVALLKATHGYEYQACETADWGESEAFSFCRGLERALIRKLPGYEDAEWSIEG